MLVYLRVTVNIIDVNDLYAFLLLTDPLAKSSCVSKAAKPIKAGALAIFPLLLCFFAVLVFLIILTGLSRAHYRDTVFGADFMVSINACSFNDNRDIFTPFSVSVEFTFSFLREASIYVNQFGAVV